MYLALAVLFVHEPNSLTISPRLAGTTFIGRGTAPVRGVACNTMIDWHDYFIADFEAGTLTWKTRPRDHFKNKQAHGAWNTKFAGRLTGLNDNGKGYLQTRLNGKLYLIHRIIYEMANGPIEPSLQIDHRDGQKSNNALSNLRTATQFQNMANVGKYRNNTSGHKGVSWSKQKRKWVAMIRYCVKQKNLGLFANIEDAIAAYAKAATLHHREFANHSYTNQGEQQS